METLLLGAWLHDLDPFVLRISGDFGVRWYGLAYIAGFVAAWGLLRWMSRRGAFPLDAEGVTDFVLALVLGVLLGGRLGYVALYQPSLLWTFQPGAPWWSLVDITRGGMASHGGMAGVIVACWWTARRRGVPTLRLIDGAALVAPVGLLFGRLANFVNGELLGKIVAPPGEPAPWWSVRYPQELLERFERSGRTPEQTEAAWALAERFLAPTETIVTDWRVAFSRAIEAARAGDGEVRAAFEMILSARHPSQLYQAGAEGLLTLAVLWWLWRRARRPGLIGAWFLIVYGAGRVATEFVRLPDAHLEVQRLLGLSRGQWMSVAMIVAGAVLLWWVVRRSGAEPVGGWGQKQNRPAREGPAGDGD